MCEDWVWWDDVGWAGKRRMGFGGRPRNFNALVSIGFPSSPLHFTLPPQVVSSEEDILHASGLPEFGVKMRPHESELLLSYLTVPYLRIPLILRFFADRSRIKERPRPSHPSPSLPPHPPPQPSSHFSFPYPSVATTLASPPLSSLCRNFSTPPMFSHPSHRLSCSFWSLLSCRRWSTPLCSSRAVGSPPGCSKPLRPYRSQTGRSSPHPLASSSRRVHGSSCETTKRAYFR